MSWTDLLNSEINPENLNHLHSPREKSHLFRSYGGGSTEVEVLDYLHALIKLIKPEYVLETGTYKAIGTVAMAHALKENGFGKLVSVELEKNRYEEAGSIIEQTQLDNFVELVNDDTLNFVKYNDKTFDLAFFDSFSPIRPLEFIALYEKNQLSNIVAFHDTSRLRTDSVNFLDENHSEYVKQLDRIEEEYGRGGMEFDLSRGLRVIQLRK